MTMKSTLIVPMTLLAALAAGVLVHDRLRTKSFVQDAAPTRTASIATAEPAAPAPVSPPPVSAPVPATPLLRRREPPPVSATVPATSEPEPPQRMTASQEASLDAWMIKTYLTCWKPAAQPADADPYVARVRLIFKPDGSLLKPPEARQSAVQSGAKATGKERVAGCQGMRPFTDAGLNIAPYTSNGRPRPSTSIRRSPPANPGHEPRGGPDLKSLHSVW